MADLDDMLARAKDQQEKLSRLKNEHDPIAWCSLVKEMLADIHQAKGPRADEFIECLARGCAFLKTEEDMMLGIRTLHEEALTGDITYQSRLGSIAEFLAWGVGKDKRRGFRLSLTQLKDGTKYGSGLVYCWHVLKNDREW